MVAHQSSYELDRLVVGINLDVAPDNPCTFSRKGLRRNATQTSSGTGDQHDLLVKYSHSFLLVFPSIASAPAFSAASWRLLDTRDGRSCLLPLESY